MTYSPQAIFKIPQIEAMDKGVLQKKLEKFVPHFFDEYEVLEKLSNATHTLCDEVQRDCNILEQVLQAHGYQKGISLWTGAYLATIRKQMICTCKQKFNIRLKDVINIDALEPTERQLQIKLEVVNGHYYFEQLVPL